MDTKRLVIGTIVGGIALHVVGYLIFDLAVWNFYLANAGPATGAFRDANLQWAIALGNLSLAALATLGVASRAGAPTIGGGFTAGAVIGFLVWFGLDFILYGFTNLWNLTVVIVDPLLSAIQYGVAGAVIAAVLGRMAKPGLREQRQA